MSETTRDDEILPDALAVAGPVPAPDFPLPHTWEGRLGIKPVTLAWRARMRWLDDGGR